MNAKTCSHHLCERRGELLPLTEFHSDRSRKDGRTPICKQCKARQAKQEWQARKDPEVQRKPSVRVYSAIKKGFRTRGQIERATGLDEDVISDALAELYDGDAVKIKRVDDEAYYEVAA